MGALVSNTIKEVSTLRILIVTVTFPFGDPEPFLYPEVKALIGAGHDLVLFPRSPRGVLSFSDLGRNVINLKPYAMKVLGSFVRSVGADPILMIRIIRELWCEQSLIVFLKNLFVLPKAVWLGKYAKRTSADHIHAHWASTTATLAMFASKISGIPWSFTAHRGDIVANNCLEKKMHAAAFVRFISRSGVELARSICTNLPMSKIHIIHMGIELKCCIESESCDINVPPVVLCPANLIQVKGHVYLLEAAAQLRSNGHAFRLCFAGQGELQSSLQKKAGALGIADAVEFWGQIPRDALLQLYEEKKIDVVVLPSIDLGGGIHEGIPVSLIEAMGSGVPVISTRTGGIPELLGGGAGVLVPPQDSHSLANALESVLFDKELRATLLLKGRKRVKEEFSIDQVCSQIVNCIVA